MSQPTIEMLVGACAGRGLDQDGGYEELYRRLGDHLVREMFSKKKRKRTSETRKPTAWHAFLRQEKERIKLSGVQGRVEVIKEAARRWKLFKQVGTDDAPLMIQAQDDELVSNLMELPVAEVKNALVVHGLSVQEAHEANVHALALALA